MKPSRRRTLCTAALPAFPLALLVGALVSPTDSTDNATQLAAASAHTGPWVAAAMFELLAAALMPFAVASVVSAVHGRGSRLANAAAVFGVLGSLGMTLIAARHLFVYGLAGTSGALHVLDRVDNGVGPVVMLLMIAGPCAWLTAAGAAARAQLAPMWVVAGALLFFVVDMLPIPEAEVLQGIVGIVTLGTVALRLVRPGAAGALPAPAAA